MAPRSAPRFAGLVIASAGVVIALASLSFLVLFSPEDQVGRFPGPIGFWAPAMILLGVAVAAAGIVIQVRESRVKK